jgi:phosphoglucosamine mutase
VALLGVLPTPAVAYLTVKTGADMGVVISASHNPFEHNGIKIFGRDGFKLSDALEGSIEEIIDAGNGISKVAGSNLGRKRRDHGFWTNEYVKYLAGTLEGGRYNGRIAIDCANGAATETARLLFRQLGAEFEIFNDEPNGVNINLNCGSTHMGFLHDMMKTGRFGIGFAFDGDADRCLVVDEFGETVDGDMQLAVLASDMADSGKLKGGGFVGTIVSNSGMDVFARDNKMTFYRADVGDRNVLEKMWETGCNLGGESSGHLIFSDETTTGDGQLTALKFLNLLIKSGKTVSELVRDVPRFPQVMPSFKLTGGAAQRDLIMTHPRLQSEIEKYNERLAGEGRVHIRPSGTEPIIRVLVEAKTERQANKIAKHFLDLMKSL